MNKRLIKLHFRHEARESHAPLRSADIEPHPETIDLNVT